MVDKGPSPPEASSRLGTRSRGRRVDRGKVAAVQQPKRVNPLSRGDGPRKPASGGRAVAATARKARLQPPAEANPTGTPPPANQEEPNSGEAPSVPLLSVADRVVTEYEKLLGVIPTLALQMGRLQDDTENMAEGLEKRVRNLVDGYRELNDLVEQAPSHVADAASDYARALGGLRGRPAGPPPLKVGSGDQERALDLERIHGELFELREAKLALDKAVTLAPELRVGGGDDGLRKEKGTRSTVRMSTTGRHPSPSYDVLRRPRKITGKIDGAATAAARTTRPSSRIALSELQVDPDLPLPLPKFPGYGKLFGEPRGSGQQTLPHLADCTGGIMKRVGSGGGLDRRGYLVVPGAVTPRQRQSHSFPQELRAIPTVPRPERFPGAAGRGRARFKVSTGIDRGLQTASSRPPTRASSLPAPGSAAAAAAAREQRRQTRLAVEELRKEMRQREQRLELELERLKSSRLRRAANSGGRGGGNGVGSCAPSEGGAAFPRRGSSIHNKGRLPTAKRGRRNNLGPSRGASESMNKIERGARGGGPAGDEKAPAGPEKAPAAEKADAEAQTVTDGVQLFLQPGPTVESALRGEQRQLRMGKPSPPSSPASHPSRKPHAKDVGSRGTTTGGGGLEKSPLTLSSCSLSLEEYDCFRAACGSRGVFPPPPVVFLEGEGRNASWKPCDDDRLLTTPGGGGGRVGCCGRTAALGMRRDKNSTTTNSGGLRSEGGCVEGGLVSDDGLGCRVVGTAQGVDAGGIDTSVGIESGNIVVTAGDLEAVTSLALPHEAGDDRWANLEGMLALSAADAAVEVRAGRGGQETCPIEEAQEKSAKIEVSLPEVRSTAAEAGVTPELLKLMREVVEQQRDLGEERSALMQALRAEVESRRVLLAQQEISLRDRESALERRETEVTKRSLTQRIVGEEGRSDREGTSGDRLIGPLLPEGVSWPTRSGEEDAVASRESWPEAADRQEEIDSGEGDVETKEDEGCRRRSPQTFRYASHGASAKNVGDGDVDVGADGVVADEGHETIDVDGGQRGDGDRLQAGASYTTTAADCSGDEVKAQEEALPRESGRAEPEPERKNGGKIEHGDVGTSALGSDGLQGCGGAQSSNDTAEDGQSPIVDSPTRESYPTGHSPPIGDSSPRGDSAAEESMIGEPSIEDLMGEGSSSAEFPIEEQPHPCKTPERPLSRVATACVQTEGEGTRRQDSLLQGTASSVEHREREGRLHLSLATAVLSVARKICDIEDRACSRAEGAEGLARRALDETRRGGEDVRRRQSEVIHRLEEMEQCSRERTGAVERELSKLRVESRLARESIPPWQALPNRPAHGEPPTVAAPGISPSSSGIDEASGVDISPPQGVLAPAPEEPPHSTPPRSASRSSLSEGQLRGSFSDGEIVRLTPRGRNALEDGELPAPSPTPPPPPLETNRSIKSHGPLAHQRGTNSAGTEWRNVDPREHLRLLMAAYPSLGNSRRRSVSKTRGTARVFVGSDGSRRESSRGESSMSTLSSSSSCLKQAVLVGRGGASLDASDDTGTSTGAGSPTVPEGATDGPEGGGVVHRHGFQPSKGGESTSSRNEPGQVDGGPHRPNRGRVAGRCLAGSLEGISTYGSASRGGGSSSSGAEVGEFRPLDLDLGSEGCRGTEGLSEAGGGEGPRPRPLVSLGVAVGAAAQFRWRRTDQGRACAERGLELGDSGIPNANSPGSSRESVTCDTPPGREGRGDFNTVSKGRKEANRVAEVEPGEVLVEEGSFGFESLAENRA